MKIMVIGSGGREHALCWKIAQSPLCTNLYAAPGNWGMSNIAETLHISVDDHQGLIEAAKHLHIDLIIIGPDDALASGLVDSFKSAGLTVFGPEKAAARLEWSKSYAKSFMDKHGIPTARWQECHSAEEALLALKGCNFPLAVKIDGLALGKGVIIAHTAAEASEAISRLAELGSPAEVFILEEFLSGRELSYLMMCDGHTFRALPVSEDHKQLADGDTGPNTGGMGAVSPPLWLTSEILSRIEDEIVIPTWQGIQQEGLDYRGILYIGLMVTADGPRVLEYNARFGDPEAQAVLLRLKSDLVPLLLACCQGGLESEVLEVHADASACLVLAAPGYPEDPVKGLAVTGLENLDAEVIPFYAGIRSYNGELQTSGGRVLALSALGSDLEKALEIIYSNAERVTFKGKQYRHDLGRRR